MTANSTASSAVESFEEAGGNYRRVHRKGRQNVSGEEQAGTLMITSLLIRNLRRIPRLVWMIFCDKNAVADWLHMPAPQRAPVGLAALHCFFIPTQAAPTTNLLWD
jgi:hypothetical protein